MKKIILTSLLALTVCLPVSADTVSARESLIISLTQELHTLIAQLNEILAAQASETDSVAVLGASTEATTSLEIHECYGNCVISSTGSDDVPQTAPIL